MAVEAHRHCAICGKPIPMTETFCSNNCEQQFNLKKQQVSKQRKKLYAIVLLFIIVWAFIVFVKPHL